MDYTIKGDQHSYCVSAWVWVMSLWMGSNKHVNRTFVNITKSLKNIFSTWKKYFIDVARILFEWYKIIIQIYITKLLVNI